MENQSESSKRPGPKSSAQTPAKKSEQKKGSDKNKSGSAGKNGGKITFSDRVLESLKSKVKEHNAKHGKKVTLSQLKKVYRRGAGAFASSHRPGKSRGQSPTNGRMFLLGTLLEPPRARVTPRILRSPVFTYLSDLLQNPRHEYGEFACPLAMTQSLPNPRGLYLSATH